MNLSKLPKLYSRLSLRWKILVPFLAVSLAVSLTGATLLGRSLEAQLYEQADEEVTQEALLVAAFLQREHTYLVSQLNLVVEEGKMLTGGEYSLVEMVSQLDPGAVMRMLGFGTQSSIKADLLKIVGPDGSTMLELRRDLLTGRVLQDEELVSAVLQGTSRGDIVLTSEDQSAYLVGAVPLSGERTARGALILGTKIDQDLLASVGLSERILFAYADQGVIACSEDGYGESDWLPVLASSADGRLAVGDERYLVASAPVLVDDEPGPISVATVLPIDALAAQAASDWTRTWVIFAAGAVVLVIAGFVVARRVVNPIRQLTTATEQLKSGDLDTRIEIKRRDEIGELANAFNTMGEELMVREQRLANAFEEVKRLSEIDPLTGLLNHRTINESLSRELARAQRYGSRFGIIIIDMDNFKLLNDTYGHPVGDEALRHMARLLVQETRGVDSVGRHGGDEFMLVLPECGPIELAGAAEKLQSVLAKTAFQPPDGRPVPLTMSLGVACYPEDGEDANTLVALADANLYLSKSRGGDTITGAQVDDMSADDLSVFGMLGSLVTVVDNKDRYTRHHSEEVTDISLAIGKALGLSEESRRVLRVAAVLHDIGKIGVPDRILRKPGRLTDAEYETIKQHSLLGDAIIAAIPDLDEIRSAVLAHHERYDGDGYPNGLSGDGIPLLARILAVADAYSAMVTDRPYRKALSVQQAIDELLEGRGTQFDPACVDAFVQAVCDHREISVARDLEAAEER